MNDLRTIKIEFDIQAVSEIYIRYENGRGWHAKIEYFVEGMKLTKNFFEDVPTLEEKLKEVQEFINNFKK